MITQERIKIEAENFLKGLDLPENADKQLIFDAFRNGMSWALMLLNEEAQPITPERVRKSREDYENSLALPEWDNKEIHGIDYQKGIEWALSQFEGERKLWLDKATDFIKSKLQGKHIEWKDEYCWNLDMFIRLFRENVAGKGVEKPTPTWKPYIYATNSTLPQLCLNVDGDGETYLYHQGYAIKVSELIANLPKMYEYK